MKPSTIENLTIAEAREIASMFGTNLPASGASHPFEVGENYYIRTVTHHLTGKLVEVHATELVLEQACWIPSDGRFADAIEKSKFDEVEPFPKKSRVIIGRGSLIDAVTIETLPVSQK